MKNLPVVNSIIANIWKNVKMTLDNVIITNIKLALLPSAMAKNATLRALHQLKRDAQGLVCYSFLLI